EPLENLARAHVVVLTRADLLSLDARELIRQRVSRIAPLAIWLEAGVRVDQLLVHGQSPRSSAILRGMTVGAFCGIGNPAGFRRTLASVGATIAGWREFPDHHRYQPRDIDSLDAWSAGLAEAQAVVCTRKDWVKLDRDSLGGRPLWALDISLEWLSPTNRLETLLETLGNPAREANADSSGKQRQ
ncbi:MAG: tetraacyldisaccharide 4'-kinase, partial [Planctomycetota bacterium]